MIEFWLIAGCVAGCVFLGLWFVAWPYAQRVIMQRWVRHRKRRTLPTLVRYGTPREGGRGTLNPPEPCVLPAQTEQLNTPGRGPLVPSPDMVVTIRVIEPLFRSRQTQQLRDMPEGAMLRARVQRTVRW